MKPVEFHPEAEADFASAAAFYARKRRGLAEEFASQIETAVRISREHPDAGALIRPDVRRWLVRRFPYSLIYRDEPTRVYVLAIAHQRRRPAYWADRR